MSHPFPKLIDRDDPSAQRAQPLFHMVPGTILSRDEVERMRALRDLNTRLQDALNTAQQEGQAQGLAQVIDQCANALIDAQAQLHRDARASQDAITTLALAVAERILLHTIQHDPDQLVGLVEHVIESFAPSARLTLALGPEAFALLEPLRERFAPQHGTHLQLRRCTNELPWAMRIESHHGSVELGLEEQLAAIATAWGVASNPER